MAQGSRLEPEKEKGLGLRVASLIEERKRRLEVRGPSLKKGQLKEQRSRE